MANPFGFDFQKFRKCLTLLCWRQCLPKRETILYIFKKIQSNHVWCYVLYKETLNNYKNEMQVKYTHLGGEVDRMEHAFENSC